MDIKDSNINTNHLSAKPQNKELVKIVLLFILFFAFVFCVFIYLLNKQILQFGNTSKPTSLPLAQIYDLKKKCREDADKFIAEKNIEDKDNIIVTYATLTIASYSQSRNSCVISYDETFALAGSIKNVDKVSFIQDIYSNQILTKWVRRFEEKNAIWTDQVSSEESFNIESQKYFSE